MPPSNPPVHRAEIIARATLDRSADRLARSLSALDEAIETAPDDGDLVLARAATLSAWGRAAEARDAYRRAEALGVRSAGLSAGLAEAHAALGQIGEAIAAVDRAVLAEPDEPRWRHLAGTLQEAAGNPTGAIACFEAVLGAHPERLESRIEFCRSLASSGSAERCAAEARRILERSPECAEAHALVGIAALMQNRPAAALESLTRATTLIESGSDLEIFDQVAVALTNLGRTAECVKMLEAMLPRYPSLNGHLGYAAALLAEGRFLDGWRQFEFRWFIGPLANLRPNYGKPVWEGQDLDGKTVLVRAEQGFGDVFQMLRYLPLLKQRGARILLQPIVEIESLYAELDGVDRVIEADRPLPPFDFWIHLMSLPRVFATTPATIPDKFPYLRVGPELEARWRGRLGTDDRLRVAIVWAGSARHANDANRSIPLARFRDLLGVPGVRFFGLHREPLTSEQERTLEGADFVNLGPELRDFGDTAAALSNLDLLISVDTSVVHVAGALGRPVWLLLPEPAEYRWLKEREDSPWYPSVRLFRQRRAGEWDEVIARVTRELQSLAQMKAAGAAPALLAEQAHPKRGHREVPVDVAASPPGIAIAAETRAGLMQFDPCRGFEGRSLERYGEHLQPVLDTFLSLVRAGEAVLEAGSGHGSHTLMIGRLLGPDGMLLAYENDPVTRRMLRQNLAAHGMSAVAVMPRGIGRLNEPDEARERREIAGEPPTDSVDALRLERLDWLKVNVGADAHAVLAGAEESLWRLRPCVLVCATGREAMPDMLNFCATYGYRAWRLDARYFSAGNFNGRTDDLFGGSGVLAVLAIPEEVEATVSLEPLQAW